MRRKSLFVVLLLAIFCSGCEGVHSSNPEDGYNTDVAMSAVEYSIFLSKQVSVVENVLATRMSMAKNVAEGNYDVNTEIENTDEAIEKVTATKDEIYVTLPAETLSSERDVILDQLEEVLDTLDEYKAALSGGKASKIKGFADDFEAEFIALSGEANVYYQ